MKTGAPVREVLKKLLARLIRPGVFPIEERTRETLRLMDETAQRLRRLEDSLSPEGDLGKRLHGLEIEAASTARVVENLASATVERDKHREELAYWRWLFKTAEGRASLGEPPEQAFSRWQADRLRELARTLELVGPEADDREADTALAGWASLRSAVEIGAGPYPALAAVTTWRRAVALDPIARAYTEEGILPAAAGHITYIESPGERTPLPAGFADLVIIENALDHVSDPTAVLREIRRLLVPGGLLWLLVDLSTYSDHMHPHPFDEARVRGLLTEAGFETVSDRISDHKSHPNAYGEYRGLLRKPGEPPVLEVVIPEEARVSESGR